MFGKNLYKILQAQKISGKELSRLTGISQSTISKFLSDDQEPRYSQIISIAKAIQLPPNVFISVDNLHLTSEPLSINAHCMIREIFNDLNLNVITLYAFKDFTMEIPELSDDALFVVVVLEGKTESKFGSLRAGNFRISKGVQYNGIKVTVKKDTKIIVFIKHEDLGDNIRSWSRALINHIE